MLAPSPSHLPLATPLGFDTLQELHATVLQTAVTVGLALLCLWLYREYRKPIFAWWSAAWGLYVLRPVIIAAFIVLRDPIFLYWHQVITGWTALAVLATALVFSRRLHATGSPWKPWYLWRYLLLLLFPPIWSYVAIYRIKNFLLAAGPMVLFLSAATLWTGIVFWREARRSHAPGARLLAAAFVLWGLHHLDYPFLRAQGAWTPWGYYLDVLFTLTVGAGILLLIADDLRSGSNALGIRSAALERLSARMLEQHEEERRRLARELHDETAQLLTAVKMELGVLRTTLAPDQIGRVDDALALTDAGIRTIRGVIQDLRPSLLDDLGLLPALRSVASAFSARSGIEVTLDLPETLQPLSPDAELALFRAVQEGLANVARHAEARSVHIALHVDHAQMVLTMRDDGRGVRPDSERRGTGIMGMHERFVRFGGGVTLTSTDTGGAVLEAHLPVPTGSPA